MNPALLRVVRPLAALRLAALTLLALGTVPGPAAAQYFGRNKVQYDELRFRVLKTPHFDIHYYPAQEEAVQDMVRMSERWYERFARTFQHDFESSKPLIFYADHPDFQQTNTLDGFISEGTGGVTESLKDRVILPLTGAYQSTDHVLGHELVHAFQYNVSKNRRNGGINGLMRLPLWLVEGMAEYLSIGREDPNTAMWMRDAITHDDFPTIAEMSRESRFFPYRFGQALWAYIGGTYGDEVVLDLFRRSLRVGFEPAIEQLLGIGHDTLSAEWARRVSETYTPLMQGRQPADEAGRLMLAPSTGSGTLNVSPVLSPDGRYIAFLSEKDLFSIDLYLADAATGRILRKLSSSTSDTHYDALGFTETSGSFSPDGSQFVFVVFAGGDNEMVIVNLDGAVERRVPTPGIGSVANPAWSPDGTQIAFTGPIGGISDLFVYELESREIRQLTQDKHADYHPSWSPDGRTLAFATDRGPETDFTTLTFGELRLALLDVETREIRVIDVFGNVRHSNPQYAPDGRSLYFVSDQDGFADIYQIQLDTRETQRITRLVTGVSGITPHSPALSVAARTGELAFSVFSEFEFHVVALPASPQGSPVTLTADADARAARSLPPTDPDRPSRVAAYLADISVGLPPEGAYTVSDAEAYQPSLALDYLGQPYFGASADAYGYNVQAGASAFFSDMLGNRVLGVALSQQGTVKDIGGQVYYANLAHRWNWAVMGGHSPYQLLYHSYDYEGDQLFLRRQRLRIYETGATGMLAYPFSTSRRIEMGLGLLRYGFSLEEERWFLDSSGYYFTGQRDRTEIDTRCSDLTEDERLFGLIACKPSSLNMVQASLAYVGDNSFMGFTSPIRGGRFRFGLEATLGTENFLTAVADWRRYYSPHQNLTFALRGFHMGRWGLVESDAIQPLYLGNETLIRGYALESFQPDECEASQEEAPNEDSVCPAFSRLIGHRLGVANLEMRVPLLGFEQFGLIDFPYIPTELVAFADAGLAWDGEHPAKLEISRSGADRIPVFSAGFSARFNLLGLMIVEAYRAYPFQRQFKGAHWGVVLSQGW
jgi:dipeptidyl aminopeptidase/acylaminoacyl peptidase